MGNSEETGPENGAPEENAGEKYQPYVSADRKIAELTPVAILLGALLGIIFAAANAAVGLRVGLTISASIPAAVMAVALFKMLKVTGLKQGTILENNAVQTIGSAGESLVAGVIFTMPAFFLASFLPAGEEYAITAFTIFITALLGGMLGVLLMIPLRRFLIKDEHGKLPYPEGTACAEVLIAGEKGGKMAQKVFAGLGAGGLYTILLRWPRLWKNEAEYHLPFLNKGVVSLEVTPALLGVGYILGYRIAALMVAGSFISALCIIPLFAFIGEHGDATIYPSTIPLKEMGAGDIWNYYIRYIGAGAVVFGGVITLIRSVPTILKSFQLGARELSSSISGNKVVQKRTDKDLPLVPVMIAALVLAVIIAWVESIPVGIIGALLVVVFSFFFVTVSSRIVGLLGSTSNPISGMTIATLLGVSVVFLLVMKYNPDSFTQGKAMIAALSVGAVVAMAIGVAGDTSQDLKTGFLVGATPWKQQIGELIGVATSACVIGITIMTLDKVYEIGSADMAAPQATIMSFVVKGIIGQDLPWALILIGASLGLAVELLGLPSLPFAVGLYLPLPTMAGVFAGGVTRAIVEKRTRNKEERKARTDSGILFASGLVGGEGIVLVVLSLILLGLGKKPDEIGLGPEWWGKFADIGAILAYTSLIFGLLYISFSTKRNKKA